MSKHRWRTIVEFELPSEDGNEREAMMRVAEAVQELNLPALQVENLKTAVAEATMNATEHGNAFNPEAPVNIRVRVSDTAASVQITDLGGDKEIPEQVVPDLELKLAGLQSPRGWGLFLIRSMVDDMRVSSDGDRRTVELIVYRQGVTSVNATA